MQKSFTKTSALILALTTVTALCIFLQAAECFVVTPSRRRSSSTAIKTRRILPVRRVDDALWMMVADSSGEPLKRRNVELRIVTPLPSAHLPDEIRTLHLYGMELDRPVHKMMMEQVVIEGGGEVVGVGDGNNKERVYGHIVWKPNSNGSLVGAIGCTAEILVSAPSSSTSLPTDDDDDSSSRSDDDGDSRITILCRGSYRFIVKEVVKTFPYPIAIVDELLDEEPTVSTTSSDDTQDEEDDDDEDDDLYADLDASELVRRTLTAMKDFVDLKLSDNPLELSPLEKSILEESGVPVATETSQRTEAEEMAAVLDVFHSTLVDVAPMPVDRYYAIAMLAAEMASMDNDIRQQILPMRDGVQRLRVVLEQLETTIGMARARKMANAITDERDEEKKDLKVGTPELPPWAKQIKEGTRLEYFWSEVDGWCGGVVAEEPMQIVDELIVTVRFDDGETHRLAFRADEKVRWRPAQ